MDYSEFRSKLIELQSFGKALLQQLKEARVEELVVVEAEHNFEKFCTYMEKSLYTLEAQANARACLERFARLKAPNMTIASLMQTHQIKISEWLLNLPLGSLEELTKPYALFLKLVDQPDMDIPSEEGDFIDTYFGREITRPLLQGKFSVADEGDWNDSNIIAESPTENGTPISLPRTGATAENIPDKLQTQPSEPTNYAIKITKPNAKFSVKSFFNEYSSPLRMGELRLLHLFARLGAFTYRQLAKHIFGDKIIEANFKRLMTQGFLDTLSPVEVGEEFFALSKYGVEIFEKAKSRELMDKIQDVPREILSAKSCLPYIETTPIIYEGTATVALFLLNLNGSLENYDTCGAKPKRLHLEGQESLLTFAVSAHTSNLIAASGYEIYIYVWPEPSLASLDRLTKEDISKIIEFKDFFANPSKSYSLAKFYEIADNFERYLVQVSDDQAQMEFFEATGNPIELQELLAKLSAQIVDGDRGETQEAEIIDGEIQDVRHVKSDDKGEEADVDKAQDAWHAQGEVQEDMPNSEPDLWNDSDPFSLAKKMLEADIRPAQHDAFDSLLNALLSKTAQAQQSDPTDYFGRAVVLLKALALHNFDLYGSDYHRLLLATDFPIEPRRYTGDELFTLFSGEAQGTACHLAALLLTLFAPTTKHDYALFNNYAPQLFEEYDKIFYRFPELKRTLNEFLQLLDVEFEGFSDKVIRRFLSDQNKKDSCQQLAEEARGLKKLPHLNQHLSGLPELLTDCFGEGSLLGQRLATVASNCAAHRNEVETFYGEFLDGDMISDERIKVFVEESWKKIRRKTTVKEIIGIAQNKIVGEFQERLEVIGRWLNAVAYDKGPSDKEQKIYATIQATLTRALEAVQSGGHDGADRALLSLAISNMLAKLRGDAVLAFKPADWLSCGFLLLQAGGFPDFKTELPRSHFFEPWRNALRHIAHKPVELREVLERIKNEKDILFDNLGQANLICQHLDDADQEELFGQSVSPARKKAEEQSRTFMDDLELDFACARISEESLELVRGEMESRPLDFWGNDFARFRLFLNDIRTALEPEIEKRREDWAKEIKNQREKSSSLFPERDMFLERADNFLRDGYFILVEDALNDFEGHAAPDLGGQLVSEEELFNQFVDVVHYNELYDLCHKNRDKDFRRFALDWVKERLEREKLSAQYIDSARRLAGSLLNTPQDQGHMDIKIMLEELGLPVKNATRDNLGASPAYFTANMASVDKNLASYGHPIAAMGTCLVSCLVVSII